MRVFWNGSLFYSYYVFVSTYIVCDFWKAQVVGCCDRVDVGMACDGTLPASIRTLFDVSNINRNVAVIDSTVLPIDLHQAEIFKCIMRNDICIITGESGSGLMKDKGWSKSKHNRCVKLEAVVGYERW